MKILQLIGREKELFTDDIINHQEALQRIVSKSSFLVHRRSKDINVSMARFANVAFSDGSLLYGFNQRIAKKQPIVAPNDIKRYFVIPEESGELCLMSCIFGENRDIFFPKLSPELNLITFSDIAINYLKEKNIEPQICKTEDEAREFAKNNSDSKKWPCLFTASNTTGEKDFEEFFTENETLNMDRFQNIGIIKNNFDFDFEKLEMFEKKISYLKQNKKWNKEELVNLFFEMIPDFGHKEIGQYLDSKM